MNQGFVDGWADVLRTEVDTAAPEFVAGDSAEDFLKSEHLDAAHEELVVAFRSKLEAVGTEVGFQHYFLPEHDSIAALFDERAGRPAIAYEKLAGFDSMAQRGATRVAENLTRMTDIEMGVDVRRINFISLDAIPGDVSNEPLVSVAFSFDGMPSGYLLFLFDEASAHDLVEATMDAPIEEGLGAFERDAIKELSNIMASGLLDGWANLLDTTIDHSTPAYTHDMGAAVVDPLIVGLSERQEFAFVFDTRIEAADENLDIDIYAIPDEEDLERALESLDVGRVAETPVAAEFVERDARPDEFENVEEIGGDTA